MNTTEHRSNQQYKPIYSRSSAQELTERRRRQHAKYIADKARLEILLAGAHAGVAYDRTAPKSAAAHVRTATIAMGRDAS